MDLLFKVRKEEFGRQLERISMVTGREIGTVIRQEAKLFVKDVLKLTPPFGTAPSTESLNAQKKVGERAVERDIRRVFSTLDLTKIRSPKIKHDLERLVRKGDLEGVRRVLRAMGIPARDVLREADPKLHEGQRDRRGRIQSRKNIWVVKDGSVKRYVREKQKHVGKAKSGWLMAARALGVSVTNWISRHSGAGVFVDRTRDRKKPMVRVGNAVDFIQGSGAELQIVKRALQNRVRNMKAKIERVLRSGWRRR